MQDQVGGLTPVVLAGGDSRINDHAAARSGNKQATAPGFAHSDENRGKLLAVGKTRNALDRLDHSKGG